jgi:hypothetical protein
VSNQDDIAALLAAANAEQNTAPEAAAQPPVAPEPKPESAKKIRSTRSNGDVLGIAWLYGSLHASVFRRQKMLKEWNCSRSVASIEDFEPALDEALGATEFQGTEVFLLLENDVFSHQTESAPGTADAARAYLHKRVQRFEKEHEPVLWVSQPTVAMRNEQAYLLHLLPSNFYDKLNRVLLERRLDLTRILPLVVPLHRELNKMPVGKDTPMLVVADAGETTVVMVGKVNGPLLFYRTILAALGNEPARVGVEVNRSLLYAKQQFGCDVEHIWILAKNGRAASHVQQKCGASKKITVLPTTAVDWLQTVIKLPARQPVNLLAGYLRRKRRRAVVRWTLLLGAWTGFAFMALSHWQRAETWTHEVARMDEVRVSEGTLRTERERLIQRNRSVAQDSELVRQIEGERLLPVPSRLLAFLGTAVTSGMRLTEVTIRWETAERSYWAFRIEGTIEGDPESSREILNAFQGQLVRSPFKAKVNEQTRVLAPHYSGTARNADMHRFVLEGGLFED